MARRTPGLIDAVMGAPTSTSTGTPPNADGIVSVADWELFIAEPSATDGSVVGFLPAPMADGKKFPAFAFTPEDAARLGATLILAAKSAGADSIVTIDDVVASCDDPNCDVCRAADLKGAPVRMEI